MSKLAKRSIIRNCSAPCVRLFSSMDTLEPWKPPNQDSDTTAPAVQSSSERALMQLSVNRPRNKVLAEIIRMGLMDLNQPALDIQNNFVTRRSLFDQSDKDPKKENRATARRQQLLRMGNECITYLNNHRSSGGLLHMEGEPIVLLEVKMTSHKRALLYWALPIHILLNKNISKLDKQYMEFQVHQQITEQGGGKEFSQHMFALLRQVYGYPPTVHLEPATNKQLMEYLKEHVGADDITGPPRFLENHILPRLSSGLED